MEEGKAISVEEMLRIRGRKRKNWGGMESNELCITMSLLMS